MAGWTVFEHAEVQLRKDPGTSMPKIEELELIILKECKGEISCRT